MSWQTYIDQICAQVSCRFAIITDSDGNILARFENDLPQSVTTEELRTNIDWMRSNPKVLQDSGLSLGGEHYSCIDARKQSILGKRGDSALCIVATDTSFLIAASTDGVSLNQLYTAVAKSANDLRQNGY